MENRLQTFLNSGGFESAEYIQLKSFHWESPTPYRPDTYFKIGVVGGDVTAVLKCYESSPRAVFENRDDPIYKDSCLEFFVAPISFKEEYVNIECNSNGAFLCEFGKGKYDRRLVSDLTALSPTVTPFFDKDEKGSFWGVEITLAKDFIADLYSVNKSDIDFDVVRVNFYKCGDDCEIPHYLAYSPVTTLPPGFHNPECFAIFKKENKND